MAKTMQDLQDAITASDVQIKGIGVQIGDLGVTIADLKVDFDAAIQALRDAIAAGTDTTAVIDALVTSVGQLGPASAALTAASDAIKAIDLTAEGISGNPTP